MSDERLTIPQPKFKVGDTVYYIDRVYYSEYITDKTEMRYEVAESKIKRIYRGKKVISYNLSRYRTRQEKDLFTTKEAAEARLKELQEGKK